MCDDNLQTLKITRVGDRIVNKNEIFEQVCLKNKESRFSVSRSILDTKRVQTKLPKSGNVDPTIMNRLTNTVSNYKNLVKRPSPIKYQDQIAAINRNSTNVHWSPKTPTKYSETGNLTERSISGVVINKKRKFIKELDMMKEEAKNRLNCDIGKIHELLQENPELEEELNETINFLNAEYNSIVHVISMNKNKVKNIRSSKQAANKMMEVKKDAFSQFGQQTGAKVILPPRKLRSRTPSPSRIDAIERQQFMKLCNRRAIDDANEAMQKKSSCSVSIQCEPDRQKCIDPIKASAQRYIEKTHNLEKNVQIMQVDGVKKNIQNKSSVLSSKNPEEIRKEPNQRTDQKPIQMKLTNKRPSNIVSSEVKNAERAQQLVTGRKLAVTSDRRAKHDAAAINDCTSKKMFSDRPPEIKTQNIPNVQRVEEAKRLERARKLSQMSNATKEQSRAAFKQIGTKPIIDPKLAAEAKCAATRNLQRSLGIITHKKSNENKKMPQKESISAVCCINSKSQRNNAQPVMTVHQKQMEQAKQVSKTRKLYQEKNLASIRGTKFPLDSPSDTETATKNKQKTIILSRKPPVVNDDIIQAEKARQNIQARKMGIEQSQATFRQRMTANVLDPKLVESAKASNIRNLQRRTLTKPTQDVEEEIIRANRAKSFVEAQKLAKERTIAVTQDKITAIDKKGAEIREKLKFIPVDNELKKNLERFKRMEQARKMAVELSTTSFVQSVQDSDSTIQGAVSNRSILEFIPGPKEDQHILTLIARTNYEPIQKLKILRAEIEKKYATMVETAVADIRANGKCVQGDKEYQQNWIRNEIAEVINFLYQEKCIKFDIISAIQDEFRRLNMQFIDKSKMLQAELHEKKKYYSSIHFLNEELIQKKQLALKKGICQLKDPYDTKERAVKSPYPLQSKLSELYKSHGFTPEESTVLPQKTLKLSKWNTPEDLLIEKEKILSCLATTINESKTKKEFLEKFMIPVKKSPSIVLNEPIQSAVFKNKKSASDKILEISKNQAKQLHLMKDIKTMHNISNLESENADNILDMIMNEEHGLNYLAPPSYILDALICNDTPMINIIGNAIEHPTSEIVPISIPTTLLNSANIDNDIDILIKINVTDLPKTDAVAETLKDQIPQVALNKAPECNVIETEVPVNSYAYETYFQVRGSTNPSWFPGYFSVMPNDKNVSLFVRNSPSEVLLEAWQKMKPNF